MERVDTLIKKLQEQFAANVPAAQMLLTVQMLQSELYHLQDAGKPEPHTGISVDIPKNITAAFTPQEEKIIEVLQVDQAAIEAELEEIKRNAEAVKKMSVANKPSMIFEEDDQPIPTLAHHLPFEKGKAGKEINDTIISGSASLNDKLKQSRIDLGETLTDLPVRDLRKAIGVNDRFLFINELFRGDESMYERSIKTINSFSILAEAEYWIQRELKTKIGWNDSYEIVKQFNQIVKRRFT